ncbi:MAG: hypothetical protein ACI4PM_04870 [Butyricicoccus sp.]
MNKTCTFFGHKQCPYSVKAVLRTVLEDLIVHNRVNQFYVGNQGQFDAYVYHTLQDLKEIYPHIYFSVVSAYVPGKKTLHKENTHTLYPEGLESVPPQYAISWRNQWMLRQSDFVVAYISHTWGNAAKFFNMAERMGKMVVNLALLPTD